MRLNSTTTPSTGCASGAAGTEHFAAALSRLSGCEDAVQEALIAAAHNGRAKACPRTSAAGCDQSGHQALSAIRSRADTARRLREQLVVQPHSPDEQIAMAADADAGDRDETLVSTRHAPSRTDARGERR